MVKAVIIKPYSDDGDNPIEFDDIKYDGVIINFSSTKGDDDFEIGFTESFNVLVKEIRSLGLSVDLLDRDLD